MTRIMPRMVEDKHAFVEFCLRHEVLRFGEFTLKSGRISPYFFNAGCFHTGAALAQLGRFYAAALQAAALPFDQLFGPAYKGIPLVSSVAIALADHHGRSVPYSFNRKEIKAHGEGGEIIGAPLRGHVLIVDDVITAGTALRASLALIRSAGAQPAGVVVAFNRQERGTGETPALQEIEAAAGAPVISLITLKDVMDYLRVGVTGRPAVLDALQAYQQRYGCPPASSPTRTISRSSSNNDKA